VNTPSLPLDIGISWSAAAVADAGEMSRLFNDVADADGIPERMSPASMEHELSTYFVPTDERTLVARDANGNIVGYATAYMRRAEAEEMRASVNVFVAIEGRGRGLEEAMAEWAIAAATEALSEVPADRRYVCTWLYKKQKDAAARFASRGFTPVRHWWEMERSLVDPVEPRSENGFDVVQWDVQYDEPARLVYNEAFADHWGSTPMDEENWAKQVIASPNFRRSMSFVALAEGSVVGYSACEEYPEDWEASGQREAWVAGLGVVSEWRKRGIATALLTRSMNAMRTHGAEAAMIGVDSDNPSGAQHLYSSVGFVTRTTGTTWQLELD
jgi:mycothiol synthase